MNVLYGYTTLHLLAVLHLVCLQLNAEELSGSVIGNLQPQEIIERANLVRVERIKEWSNGIEEDSRCEHDTNRCKLGLVCTKKKLDGLNYCKPCKPISTMKLEIESLVLKEGELCSLLSLKQCGSGLACTHNEETGLRLCVVSIQETERQFDLTSFFGLLRPNATRETPSASTTSAESGLREFFNKMKTNIMGRVSVVEEPDEATEKGQSSVLKAGEYAARSNDVFQLTSSWVEGLKDGETCNTGDARCSYPLVCQKSTSSWTHECGVAVKNDFDMLRLFTSNAPAETRGTNIGDKCNVEGSTCSDGTICKKGDKDGSLYCAKNEVSNDQMIN